MIISIINIFVWCVVVVVVIKTVLIIAKNVLDNINKYKKIPKKYKYTHKRRIMEEILKDVFLICCCLFVIYIAIFIK